MSVFFVYLFYFVPKIYNSIGNVSYFHIDSSVDYSGLIRKRLLYIQPCYVIWFMICSWINHYDFNFKSFLYSIMSLLLFSIGILNMCAYGLEVEVCIFILFIPIIIVTLIAFSLGLFFDLSRNDKDICKK